MYTTTVHPQFAICISGEEDSDLEVWKVYRILADPKAEELGCLRVVDESGEDYLYPNSQFVLLDLSPEIAEKLLAAL